MDTCRLAVIDVGHGNSTVIEDQEHVVIVDTGIRHGLLSYLTERNITKIDVILLSHADADHIGGLVGILSSGLFQIGEIRVNTDAQKKSNLWDTLLYELDSQNRRKTLRFIPSLTDSDNGAFNTTSIKIEILGPSTYLAGKGVGSTDRSNRRIETNTISAVIRITRDEIPIVLLSGDIDEVGLDNLLERQVDLRANILVFPHHGGRAGRSADMVEFTQKLCKAVRPQRVIFSIDRERTQLRPEIITTIRSSMRGVRIACTQLSKLCAQIAPNRSPMHLNASFAAGRELHHCCAGTVILEFGPSQTLTPIDTEHLEFIKNSAPTALCNSGLPPSVLSDD